MNFYGLWRPVGSVNDFLTVSIDLRLDLLKICYFLGLKGQFGFFICFLLGQQLEHEPLFPGQRLSVFKIYILRVWVGRQRLGAPCLREWGPVVDI